MQQPAAPQRPGPAFLPINALMLQAVKKVEVVIQELGRRGFAVVGIDMSTPSRPTVQIQTSARCAQLIESGQAAYYGFGLGQIGHFREGQFCLDGCRVVWTENAN